MHLHKAQSENRRVSSRTPVSKDANATGFGTALIEVDESEGAERTPLGFVGVLKKNCFLTSLIIFLPLGFAAKWQQQPDWVIFFTNFLGIIPLAWLIGKSTEDIAAVTGEVVGGLLNATFGNVVEMMMCVASIKSGQLVITKCTLLGSILSNLLLVMGCSCVAGGYYFKQQHFTEQGAHVHIVMLVLSVTALGMTTGYADTMGDVDEVAHEAVLKMSRYISILLLVSYGLYLFFQMKTHTELFGAEAEDDSEGDMSPGTASAVLGFCTVLCAIATEFLIGSIEGTIETWGLTKEFVGIILLPIIGNAAEHYTAITVAMVNKMDLALGVAVGSSCQMAMLVAPFAVLVGWFFNQDMSLDFHSFQIFVLCAAVVQVASVLFSRSTHWLSGVMLLVSYFSIAIVYLCESPHVSTFSDRTGEVR